MDLSVYKTDRTRETEGVWRKISGDARVKVARITSPRYRAALTKWIKHFIPVGIDPEADVSGVEKATIHAMAEAILLDWENITLDGVDLPYSTENAVKVLTDYPDFREIVSAISQDRNNYKPENIVGE